MNKKQKAMLMMFRRDIHNLEYDPQTQYRFHFYAAWFWFSCMLLVPLIPQFRHALLSLLIMEASLWANFATHFGSMSSAIAARNGEINNATIKKTATKTQAMMPPAEF
jgi:hypothetical protein